MKFWAATDKQSLVTVYLGIHETVSEAWQIFLGWPSDDEVQEAKLKFVLEQVAIYPVAQACRPYARSPQDIRQAQRADPDVIKEGKAKWPY